MLYLHAQEKLKHRSIDWSPEQLPAPCIGVPKVKNKLNSTNCTYSETYTYVSLL